LACAAGPIVSAIRTLGEEPVCDALTDGIRPQVMTEGTPASKVYRYLIAIS